MFFGSSIKDTTIIKDIEDNGAEIGALFSFMKRVEDKKIRQKIYKDMMLFKYGLEGEKRVLFELKNSFMPMHIFHNVRVVDGDYSAQIDLIAVTLHYIMVFETKQLMGDVEITSDGEFIRYFKTKSGKYYKKEAIYSPLSQAERHANILRSILRKKGLISEYPVVPMVVLANSKSIINKSHAPAAISEKVCRVDQLINYMKDLKTKDPTKYERPDKGFLGVSKYLSENHVPQEYNYAERYRIKEKDLLPDSGIITKEEIDEYIRAIQAEKDEEIKRAPEISMKQEKKPQSVNLPPKKVETETSLESRLKQYRLEQAKKYDIAPPFIFSNKELEDILKKKPTTAKEVSKLPGFGPKKTERHASDIAQIIKNHK